MYGPCVFPDSYVLVCAFHLQPDCCGAFEWIVRDKFCPLLHMDLETLFICFHLLYSDREQSDAGVNFSLKKKQSHITVPTLYTSFIIHLIIICIVCQHLLLYEYTRMSTYDLLAMLDKVPRLEIVSGN